MSQLQVGLEREQKELERDRIEHAGRKQEELLSAGESVLSVVLGRRRSSALSQASRRRRITEKARAEVEESERTIAKLKGEIDAVLKERDAAVAMVRDTWGNAASGIRDAALRPRRTDIRVDAFGLAWVPFWVFALEDDRGTRYERVSAFQREG